MAWASECFLFDVESERDSEDLGWQEARGEHTCPFCTSRDQKGWPPSVCHQVPPRLSLCPGKGFRWQLGGCRRQTLGEPDHSGWRLAGVCSPARQSPEGEKRRGRKGSRTKQRNWGCGDRLEVSSGPYSLLATVRPHGPSPTGVGGGFCTGNHCFVHQCQNCSLPTVQ